MASCGQLPGPDVLGRKSGASARARRKDSCHGRQLPGGGQVGERGHLGPAEHRAAASRATPRARGPLSPAPPCPVRENPPEGRPLSRESPRAGSLSCCPGDPSCQNHTPPGTAPPRSPAARTLPSVLGPPAECGRPSGTTPPGVSVLGLTSVSHSAASLREHPRPQGHPAQSCPAISPQER